jgi:hypothetical protein
MPETLDRPRVVAQAPSERSVVTFDVPLGPAAALLVAGWMLVHDRRIELQYTWASIAAALAFVMLARPIARRGLLQRIGVASLQIATVLLIFLTADRALDGWEEHGPRFGAASTVASTVLNLAGYRTAVEGGLLLVDHPDGLVKIVPTMEKLALRPFLLSWLAWIALRLMRSEFRWPARSLTGLATTLLVAMARYVVLLAVYVEHDNILAGNAGQAALDLFASPWITGFFLVVAGLAADRAGGWLAQDAPTPSTTRAATRKRATVLAGVAIAALGGAAATAWSFVPPGAEKTGRILIDDRYCGIWEPTARQLDTQWYGDFPTYSFTSLAEWLGKWYSIDANTSKAYDDELLSHYDVLILKTPEEPIPDTEAAAIDRFVRWGGGLLLVGDHTNLLGMGTHLNALSARYGIRFRYDSVSDGVTGGFVDCVEPRFGRHVGALHVDKLEFMTSCSLQLSGNAETVLAADDCRREPHDYAGSSFFGRRGPHPEMEHGRTVLAATVRVGRGQIAAFTDSTVWSSFAIFSHDRDKLAMDLVRLLNREPSGYETPLRCVAIIAAFMALLVGLAMVRSRMALPALLLGLVGGWSGLAATDMLHRSLYALPEPNSPISEVAFLWQGGACAFPPVLGTPESLPADRSFDTLLVSVQRLGLVPRVAYTYDEDLFRPDTRAIFVVAPVNVPPAKTMSRLRDFVRRGGSLIVLDDSRFGQNGSGKDFLGLFDVSIAYHAAQADHGTQKPHVHLDGGMEPLNVPSGEAFVARKLYEQGQLIYMSDAADFSREGMGHCFARPWKAARARYETIYSLFRDVLRIVPADRRFYGVL